MISATAWSMPSVTAAVVAEGKVSHLWYSAMLTPRAWLAVMAPSTWEGRQAE